MLRGDTAVSDSLRSLTRRLRDDRRHAPVETLGPVTALREMEAASSSMLGGTGALSDADRRSTRRDVARAFDQLGPEAAKACRVAISAIRAELGQLPALLSSPDGARRLSGLAQAALSLLRDADAIAAAWQDVLDAFEGDADAAVCELRLFQLEEFVGLGGGDWPEISRRLQGLLTDSRDAFASLGLIDPPASASEYNLPAGFSPEDRLAACLRLLRTEPEHGQLAVWLGFSNAMLRDGYLKVGDVEFFGHQGWPDAARAGWPTGSSARQEELGDPHGEMFFSSLPDPPFVLVRVDLGHGVIGDAIRKARVVVADLVRAARPGTEWRLMRGAGVFVRAERSGWFGSLLQVDRDQKTGRFSPEFEPTSDRLAQLDTSLVERLLADDPTVRAVVRDLAWMERVALLEDDGQQVALGLRIVDRLLPSPEGGHWSTSVTRYLKDFWCAAQMYEFIRDVAHNIVAIMDSPMPVLGQESKWRERLMPSSGPTSYTVRLDETLRALDDAAAAMPADTLQHRTVIELRKRTMDSESLLRWKAELGEAFDILLARAVRQRNALIHGADTLDETVRSVVPFVGWLQGRLTVEALDALAGGEALLARLERLRLRAQARWCRLEDGVGPLEALFD